MVKVQKALLTLKTPQPIKVVGLFKNKYIYKKFILKETNFILSHFNLANALTGSTTWKTPSNIALVKYWGKEEPQLPKNTSISFTLDACFTLTTLHYTQKQDELEDFSFEVFFEGKEKEDFKPKIRTFFKRIEKYVPFLKNYHFVIKSRNSFPHSSGIASSASGMSALALCIMSLEKALSTTNISETYFKQKASFLARLGSGSACRSIEGKLIVWGKHTDISKSSNLFGVKFPFKVHEKFKNYHDTILLVDEGEKEVSSTVGHNLMHQHPFAEQRFIQANKNAIKLSEAISKGSLKTFIQIVESEALSLHAMMLTSTPYFILMKPNTLKIINKIWEFRQKNKSNICFTLDAGANVHVLYPEIEKKEVNHFIVKKLLKYCQKNHYICDRIGSGAKQILNKEI